MRCNRSTAHPELVEGRPIRGEKAGIFMKNIIPLFLGPSGQRPSTSSGGAGLANYVLLALLNQINHMSNQHERQVNYL